MVYSHTLLSWNWLSNIASHLSLGIFRNEIPRKCNSAFPSYNLRISSSSVTQNIPGLIFLGKSRSRHWWTLRFSSLSFSKSHWCFRCYLVSIRKEMMSNSLRFSKNAKDGPSWAGGLSTQFPEVPVEFHVLCGKPGSLRIFPVGTPTFSRVDWERGTFQSCSLYQDQGILFLHSWNSPCPAVPELGTKADWRWMDFLFPLHRTFITSRVSDSIRSLTAIS